MRKIYIPTSTLNFNNILSTESISPVSFYADRDFGYKSFMKVDPNNFDNSIIAYSQIPEFHIEESELDDYPLIIEVAVDLIKSLPEPSEMNNIKIYQINETIYFHPNKIRLLFFSEEHKKICLIKSTPSIETKFVPIYEPRISLIMPDWNSFRWGKKYLKDIVDPDRTLQSMLNDKKSNAAKGFYFAYVLGQTYSYKARKEKLIDILSTNNKLKNKLILDGEFNEIINLNNQDNKQVNEFKNSKKIKFDVYFDNNNNVSSLHDNDSANLYKEIINELFKFEIVNAEEFKSKKVDLLLKVGENFKIFSDDWNNSEERIYINSLLDHLETYTPFDINNTKNLILKSLAVFILKGDNLEKLSRALKENGILAFQYAFGLWGAIFGFSAIPKTMTNSLFEESSLGDFQILYKNVQEKIHHLNNETDIRIEKISTINIVNNPESDVSLVETPLCEKCGSEMELRTNHKTNSEFYGCSNYPDCQYTLPSDGKKPKNFIKKAWGLFGNSDDSNLLNEIVNQLKIEKSMKITDLKKILPIDYKMKNKSNAEIINFIAADTRLGYYKKGNTAYIELV